MRTYWRNNGLSVVLFTLFAVSMAGQAVTGWYDSNEDARAHGDPAIGFSRYLASGHFWEATAENWESEFLFALLFVVSFAVHGIGGLREFNQQRLADGEPPANLSGYMTSSTFWFESFQNWQSEFLSLAAMVVGTIFLRQRGSAESKPVHAPHSETGR